MKRFSEGHTFTSLISPVFFTAFNSLSENLTFGSISMISPLKVVMSLGINIKL